MIGAQRVGPKGLEVASQPIALFAGANMLTILTIGDNLEVADYALQIAQAIRAGNIPAWTDGRNVRLKKKLELAEKQKARYAIIVGETEAQNNTVNLKYFPAKKQEPMSLNEALEEIFYVYS